MNGPPRALGMRICSNWLDEGDGDDEAATRPATKASSARPPAEAARAAAVLTLPSCAQLGRRRRRCELDLPPLPTTTTLPSTLHQSAHLSAPQVELDLVLSAHANARSFYDNRRKHRARGKTDARATRLALHCTVRCTSACLHAGLFCRGGPPI